MDKEQEYFRRVIRAFRYYYTHAVNMHAQKTKEWTRLPLEHRQLLPEYEQKLDQMHEAIEANWKCIRTLVPKSDIDIDHDNNADDDDGVFEAVPEGEMEKVRSVLRQLVRDWSEEGQPERIIYSTIISDLHVHLSNTSSSEKLSDKRVLVPGAGLGRLVYEIAKSGLSCQGNEFSFYMLLVSNYLLNRCTQPGQFEIYPWSHSFANHRTSQHQFKRFRVPDEQVSGQSIDFAGGVEFSMTAGEFEEVYATQQEYGQWDALVSCFFIDTAHNIFSYIRLIHDLLVPGGVWINYGPLLYHFESIPGERSVELTLEEVVKVAERVGFVIRKREEMKDGYCRNAESMLVYDYTCSYIIFQKPFQS